MIALLLLIVVLAVRSMTLDGASEGLAFYLKPDFARMKEVGVLNTMAAAMNQSFFTMSLGIGAMLIFGSYMGRDHALLGEAGRIAVLDTFVAVCSGLIIFPACFAFDVTPDQGPSLIFVTLPSVFNSMAGGRIWGALFFLFMAFASITTVLAVFENIVACCMEKWNMSRKKRVFSTVFWSLFCHCRVCWATTSGAASRSQAKTSSTWKISSSATCCCRSEHWYIFCSAFHAWMGIRQLPERSQYGQGCRHPELDPRLCHLCPSDPPGSHSRFRAYLIFPMALLVCAVLFLRNGLRKPLAFPAETDQRIRLAFFFFRLFALCLCTPFLLPPPG